MDRNLCFFIFFSGKSLICKEKAIQTAEKQDNKPNSDPVFFISLVGTDEFGFVNYHEHIFDIYTKEYEFVGRSVKVISALDLNNFYIKHHKMETFRNVFSSEIHFRKTVDIYTMVKFFVEQHSNGHFVVDECPFRRPRTGKLANIKGNDLGHD